MKLVIALRYNRQAGPHYSCLQTTSKCGDKCLLSQVEYNPDSVWLAYKTLYQTLKYNVAIIGCS